MFERLARAFQPEQETLELEEELLPVEADRKRDEYFRDLNGLVNAFMDEQSQEKPKLLEWVRQAYGEINWDDFDKSETDLILGGLFVKGLAAGQDGSIHGSFDLHLQEELTRFQTEIRSTLPIPYQPTAIFEGENLEYFPPEEVPFIQESLTRMIGKDLIDHLCSKDRSIEN